jgi:hypothetical protein
VDPVITSAPLVPAVASIRYEYPVRAQDADFNELSFRLQTAPAGLTIGANSGLIRWTPTAGQVGQHAVEIVVDDGFGGLATQSYTLPVFSDANNQPPVITSAPRNVIELGQSYFYAVQAVDPNHDPLTFSLTSAPAGMMIAADEMISWDPLDTQPGTHQVRLAVDDGRGGQATQDFPVNVVTQGSNQPPQIVSTPRRTAAANSLYSYNLAAVDPEGDPLVWSLPTKPIGMSIDPQRGTLRWTPSLAQIGSHSVLVRVDDVQGGAATQAFFIDVQIANAPPVISSVPPRRHSTRSPTPIRSALPIRREIH